jgi:peptidyl-prolyl cis-trans isomerase-like 3
MSVTLHTALGDLKIELECELCPLASSNFLALCASGYYDGCVFHRNVRQYLVQGGDPSGTGRGGESALGGFFADEIVGALRHDRRGVVAMANKGVDTNASQFYITYARAPQLDGKSTVFGRVIHGLDTLDKLEQVAVDAKYRPLDMDQVRILKVTVHANPFASTSQTLQLKQ